MGDENKGAPKENHVYAVSFPVTKFVLIQIVTFCGPLLPVLAELGFCVWLVQTIPSIPFILWAWMGPAGMWIFLFPLFAIGMAYTYIAACVLLTTTWIHRWNRQCPPEEGYFSRKFTEKGVADRRIDYYHARGFAIKWAMWVTSKSPFPWLVNWCLQRNDNEFGKNVVFDNAFLPLELCELGDNVYFGPGSAASAHTVNAIFGDLFIGKVKIESNVIVGANAIIGPGSRVLQNTVLFPNGIVPARWKDKWGTKFYAGTPVGPVPSYSGTFIHPKDPVIKKEK